MKTIFIFFAMVASFTSMAETTPDVDRKVLKSFNKMFNTAKEVGWTVNNKSYSAQFVLDGQHIKAYYNCDGTLLALTRNLSVSELPIRLQAGLKKEYTTFWITDLFELSGDQATTYYVTLENADEIVVLKSNGAEWLSHSKQHKS